jgi:hypothetical protein
VKTLPGGQAYVMFDRSPSVDVLGGDRIDRNLQEIFAFPEIVLQGAECDTRQTGDAPHGETRRTFSREQLDRNLYDLCNALLA